MNVQAVAKKKRKTRTGKGFSQEELGEVGLSFTEALKMDIPIDKRRRSKHKENVDALRKHLERDETKA